MRSYDLVAMAVRDGVVLGVPGSAGVFRTQYVDLPEPLELDCGRTLDQVRIAYEAYGRLSPSKDNVILVCHALSGDAHAAGWSDDPEAPSAVDGFRADERGIAARGGLGWWDGMIGPGKAFDTDRYYVVCTNLLGSCRGSTGPASLDPRTGQPYGLNFPVVTVGDMGSGSTTWRRGQGCVGCLR
jgi:homoserine O-acetyltransferase